MQHLCHQLFLLSTLAELFSLMFKALQQYTKTHSVNGTQVLALFLKVSGKADAAPWFSQLSSYFTWLLTLSSLN